MTLIAVDVMLNYIFIRQPEELRDYNIFIIMNYHNV